MATNDGDGLFVYGTLLFPDVLRILLGRVPETSPAVAPGWRVRALPGVVYPGLVAEPAGTASGLLMSGLTEEERRILDAYEDDDYEVRGLDLDGGRRGWAYVWRYDAEPHDWDPAAFAARELATYLDGCTAWRRAYRT